MDKLILKIYETFDANQALFGAAGLEPVKHIDLYRGQPLNPEQFEYYDIPALFLDYTITWSKEGKYYNGILQLDVHVITDATWETSNVATNRLEGLKKTAYLTLLRRLLDTVESENTSKLQRLNERPIDTGVVNYHVLSYNCNYYDPQEVGKPTMNVLPEGVTINGSLVKKILNNMSPTI